MCDSEWCRSWNAPQVAAAAGATRHGENMFVRIRIWSWQYVGEGVSTRQIWWEGRNPWTEIASIARKGWRGKPPLRLQGGWASEHKIVGKQMLIPSGTAILHYIHSLGREKELHGFGSGKTVQVWRPHLGVRLAMKMKACCAIPVRYPAQLVACHGKVSVDGLIFLESVGLDWLDVYSCIDMLYVSLRIACVFPESVWAKGSSNSGNLSSIFTSSHHIFKSSHLLILTSSHLHILTSSHPHIFASSHLHICSSSHLLTFTSSHPHILTSSHPHIFTSSHLHILTPSHLHILTSSHLLIFTSSHLHITSSHLLIFTSSHPHIFTSSHSLLPSCALALLPSCSLALLLPCLLLFPSFLFLS